MKRQKWWNALLAVALAGQMTITAVPVYAADDAGDGTDTEAASAQIDPRLTNQCRTAMNCACGTHLPAQGLTGRTVPW